VLRSVSVFRVASVFRGAFVLGIASVQRSASAVVSWLDGYLEKKEVDIAAPYYHGWMGCFEKWEMDIPAPRRHDRTWYLWEKEAGFPSDD
jgi:hypothetical protein